MQQLSWSVVKKKQHISAACQNINLYLSKVISLTLKNIFKNKITKFLKLPFTCSTPDGWIMFWTAFSQSLTSLCCQDVFLILLCDVIVLVARCSENTFYCHVQLYMPDTSELTYRYLYIYY